MKERVHSKKEIAIDNMSNDEVVNELKVKKLPTYGTAAERKDRLKKHYGIHISILSFIGLIVCQLGVNDSTLKDGTNQPIGSNILASNGQAQAIGSNNNPKKSSCLDEIERLKQNREERRKKMEDLKKQKTERE